MHHNIESVHQIYIVDGLAPPSSIPSIIQNNINQLRRTFPSAKYKMWHGASIRDFLAQHFDESVLWAFDILHPYAYKSDLARMCLLYVFGGLYVDLSIFFFDQLKIPLAAGICTFRDRSFMQPGWSALTCGVTWSKPGRPELRLIIDQIVQNCRTRFYGRNPLYPTGPILWGQAFVKAMHDWPADCDLDEQWIGDIRSLTPEGVVKNLCFVTPDSRFVAIIAKTIGGDLLHLGAKDVNNYNQIWSRRQVYGEPTMQWDASSARIQLKGVERSTEGVRIPKGFCGLAIYGPYVDLAPGDYVLVCRFSGTFSRLTPKIQVTAGSGSLELRVFKERSRRYSPGGEITVPFSVKEQLDSVEFPITFESDFYGYFLGFELKPQPSAIG